MTWTTPKTWALNEVLTSNDMNTLVSDNLAYLYDNRLKVIIIADRKPLGTLGASITVGAMRTRELNTKVYDPFNLATLSANQITLSEGKYLIKAVVPVGATAPQFIVSRLYSITDTASLGESTVGRIFTTGGGTAMAYNYLSLVVNFNSSKILEVQSEISSGTGSASGGYASGLGVEQYTTVEIYKFE